MHTMSSVKTESPSSNDLELNIIKILFSLYSQRAITSSTSAIIGRRKFTHISPYVLLKTHFYASALLLLLLDGHSACRHQSAIHLALQLNTRKQ